jgi:hypothetical protein
MTGVERREVADAHAHNARMWDEGPRRLGPTNSMKYLNKIQSTGAGGGNRTRTDL